MKKIKLTMGKFALVDNEDFEELSKNKWHFVHGNTKHGYASRLIFNKEIWKNHKKNRSQAVRMHNQIMRPPKGMVVDHINGDGLNNQKKNLRICTPLENYFNRPKRKDSKLKYRGIIKHGHKFGVQIMKNGKIYRIHGFNTQKEAALEYNKMAKILHGEFASLNKI